MSPERLLSESTRAGPIGRRRAAQPAVERRRAGTRARLGARGAGLRRHGGCLVDAACAQRRSRSGPSRTAGDDAAEMAVVRHAGALTSIDELNSQASGWGLISVDTHARRRPPHPARRQRPGHAGADAGGRDAARRLRRPVDPADRGRRVGDRPERRRDRACRPRRTARFASTTRSIARDRFVSAIDVLEDRVDPALLRKQMVLIGFDRVRPAGAPGHADRRADVGQRDPGAAAREPARRHAAAPAALGAGRRGAAPPGAAACCWSGRCAALHPLSAALLMLVVVALAVLGAFGLYRAERVLLDAATPSAVPAADLRRAARALAGRGDAPAPVARKRRPGPARAQRAHRRRARGGAAHPDREPAAPGPPARRRSRRSRTRR